MFPSNPRWENICTTSTSSATPTFADVRQSLLDIQERMRANRPTFDDVVMLSADWHRLVRSTDWHRQLKEQNMPAAQAAFYGQMFAMPVYVVQSGMEAIQTVLELLGNKRRVMLVGPILAASWRAHEILTDETQPDVVIWP